MSLDSLGLDSLGLAGSSAALTAPQPVFMFSPNWSSPVTEVLEWLTDVFEAHNRVEQRRAVRDVPDHKIQYSILAHGASVKLLEDALSAGVNSAFSLPLWMDATKTADSVPRFGTSITCDTTHRRFIAGGRAVIFTSLTVYEVVDIEAVSLGGLILADGVHKPWPRGAKILPLVDAWLELETSAARKTAGVLTVSVSFSLIDSDDALFSEPAAEALDGVEIFTLRHNWTDEIDLTLSGNSEHLSFGRGLESRFSRGHEPIVERSVKSSFFDRGHVTSFREFLSRRKGRLTPCYVSSGAADYELASPIASGAVDFIVKKGGARTKPDALEVVTRAETYTLLVDSMVATATATRFELADPCPVALSSANVVRISAVRLSRLASDRVSLTWRSATVAEASYGFKSVSAVAPRRASAVPIEIVGAVYSGGDAPTSVVALPEKSKEGDLVLSFAATNSAISFAPASEVSLLFSTLGTEYGYKYLKATDPSSLTVLNTSALGSSTLAVVLRRADGIIGTEWLAEHDPMVSRALSGSPQTISIPPVVTNRQRSMLLVFLLDGFPFSGATPVASAVSDIYGPLDIIINEPLDVASKRLGGVCCALQMPDGGSSGVVTITTAASFARAPACVSLLVVPV